MKKKIIAMLLCTAMVGTMLTGCNEKKEEDNRELVLYTWEGLFPQEVLDSFEEEKGIKIISSNFDSNETMLEKVQQSDGKDYDLVIGDDYIIEQVVNSGLAKELDKAKLTNYGNINPLYQSQFYDPDNKYTIPHGAGIPLIVYDPEQVDFEIKGYSDLWNPELEDKIATIASYRAIEGMVLLTMGKSMNEEDPAVIKEAGEKLLPAMLEFYRLCGIRKPEFMGWNQVELDKKKYTKGWSPVKNTDFSLTEFGGELDRYLESYEAIKEILSEVEPMIPQERKDAFFAQIKYPVFGAAAMSTKMLEAQRARCISPGSCDTTLWTRESQLMAACAKSIKAYQEIRDLTDYYNNELADGKWKYSMCHNPRDLYVFYPPEIPIWLTDKEIEKYASFRRPKSLPLEEVAKDHCIVSNACDYTSASKGVVTIQSLGHSMNAVSVPKGKSITFEFDCLWDGEAILRTAVIPTQPNDKGDIRFSVSIDGEKPRICSIKEPFRSEGWKQNVLRGQAVRETGHQLTKGKHTLSITALDDHVLIDQWMIDFKPDRMFYVFPVQPTY